MLEMMLLATICMTMIFVPYLLIVGICHIGMFALYRVYKRNGGKYNYKKFIETRGLYF